MLCERCAYLYNVPLEDYFTGMLNKRIGQALLKAMGIAPLSRLSSTLSENELKRLTTGIKAWRFKIEGTKSWNNAQVTRGGAYTSEFDGVSFESKLVKGLYACGEVLDIDGDCGGYNLQWAWSSGYLAGKAAAK
jgi:predicted Rossmann fold flavoprotein